MSEIIKTTYTPGPWVASGDTVFAADPNFKVEGSTTSGFRCVVCSLDDSQGVTNQEEKDIESEFDDIDDEDEYAENEEGLTYEEAFEEFAQKRLVANCHLIAAAPDLLGVVEIVDAALGLTIQRQFPELYEQMTNALSKARGGGNVY